MEISQPINFTRQRQILAAGLMVIAATCFSVKAVLIKLAYRYEVDSTSLLALRMAFSTPIFILVAWWNNRRQTRRMNAVKMSRQDLAKVAALGLTGYYLASFLDFYGLRYISAGLERLVLFTYPTLVLLISAAVLKKKVTRIQLISLGITYFGVLLVFADRAHLGNPGQFRTGALLIFGSALAYAIYMVGSGTLLHRIGTLKFTSYAMTAAGAGVLIHHGIFYQWRLFHFVAPVYYLSFAMAIIATVLPTFLVAECIRVIGANNTSIISGIGPITTIIMAWFILGERVGPLQWAGTIFAIAGVLLISLKRQRT
ncbi:MAG: DMT family transporter [Lewinella sp.]|nr:DMT family transporter [Lewinella sp.]